MIDTIAEISFPQISNRSFNIIILAAGLGSRLRPETDRIPKALIKIGKQRAIDYLIQKYGDIADRIIIAVGYGGNLLEKYVKEKYESLNIVFSREDISQLQGPGKSLVYALDLASSRLPTLITFCDYIVEDSIHIDTDTIGVCKPIIENYAVIDKYKTLAIIDNNIIIDIINNDDLDTVEHGFTGIAVCHDTLLLKSITYNAASELGVNNIEYTIDIIRPYIAQKIAIPSYISRLFEFGTKNTLKKTRIYANNGIFRTGIQSQIQK
jgi:GTP:adenosylcobinamide-phosphate guanylyltransferase